MEKIKNLPVMRFVAFAVALVILLGIFSVILSFTASAESTNDISTSTDYDKDITLGFLKNYSCLKLSYSSEIDYLHLRNLYYASSSPYTIYSLFGVDSSGKLVHLTSNYGESYNNNDYSGYQYAGIPDTYYLGKSYKFKLGFSVSPADSSFMCFNMYKSNFDSDDFHQYVTYSSFSKSLYSNFYLVYTGLPDKDSATFNSFITDVSSNISSSDYKDYSPPPTGGSENGRFISFGNYVDYFYDDHLSDISKNCIYQRNDFNSSIQSKYTAFMYDTDSYSDWTSVRVKSSQLLSYSSTSIAFCYFNNTDLQSSVKLRISKTMLRPTMRESDNPFDVVHYFRSHHANQHYSRYVILNGGSLQSVPANSTGTFKINLQGYCDMNYNSYYLLELVDGKTSDVLSSIMFLYTGKDTFKIDGSNNKNGQYISVDYQYDDGNKVYDKNISPDIDGVLPDLPNGSKDETFSPVGDLSKIDITDIFSSLNEATASVGAFFQACFNIIPVTLITIILGSLSLIIVLRVLGR